MQSLANELPSKDFVMQFDQADAVSVLPSWEGRLSEVITSMQVQLIEPNISFSALWQHIDLDSISINIHSSPPQRVVHDYTRPNGESRNNYVLLYMTQSSICLDHNGRKVNVPEGHLVLMNLNQPFVFDSKYRSESVGLHVNEAWLHRWLPAPEAWIARPIYAGRGWAAPFVTLLRTIAIEGLNNLSIARSEMSDHLGTSLSLLVAGGNEDLTPPAPRGIYQRLYKEILSSYQDPTFVPTVAAERLGISRRYLHSICAKAGSTFSGLLMEVRLRKTKEMLTNHRFQYHRVGEIAYMCGFSDQSHFARRFRGAFGVSPKAFRQGKSQD